MDSFLRREREVLKQRWTQVLVLLTCLAMILLVTQQGSTIDTQQSLIRVLWDDSQQLNNIRIQDLTKKREQTSSPDSQKGNQTQKPPDSKPAKPEAAPNGKHSIQNDKPQRVLKQI